MILLLNMNTKKILIMIGFLSPDQENTIACNERRDATENSTVKFDEKVNITNSGKTNRKLRIKKKINYKV